LGSLKSIEQLIDNLEETGSIEVQEEPVAPVYTFEQLEDANYDEMGDKDGLYDFQLNEGLEEWEVKEALRLSTISRGIMLVTGAPGGGKGLFANWLAWKLRHYFKGKKVFLDYKPRKLFDMYAPPDNKYHLFNSQFMSEQLKAMAQVAGTNLTTEKSDEELKGKALKKAVADTTSLAKGWVEKNQLLLRNGVMVLDEFKRYFHNRRPHNPYGILLGNVITVWRHLDLLMIGMTPFKREIDAISCLPYVTHHVKCSWNGILDCAEARVFKIRYVGTRGVIEITGKPIKITIDGRRPRKELGGNRYYDLYPSKNITDLTPNNRINA
jgi:hypothetical protein